MRVTIMSALDGSLCIYDMPYTERRNLCNILDNGNKWKDLGGEYMGYVSSDLERFGRALYSGNSPTDKMLQEWGQQNKTILELYMFLHGMRHYQAMRAIKSCVPEEYRRLQEPALMYKEGLRKQLAQQSSDRESSVNAGAQNSRTVARAAAVNGSALEGATALPNYHQTYGPENLNENDPSTRQRLPSQKVPKDLLTPTPQGIQPNEKPRPVNHHYAECNGKSPQAIPSKINNDRCNGRLTELSCDDNNANVSQPSCSKKQPYDAMSDYIRKAKEKEAKLREEASAVREPLNQLAPECPHKINTNGTSPPTPEAIAGLNGHPVQPSPSNQQPSGNQRERPKPTVTDVSRHGVPVIPYKELEEGTACWSPDNILGEGGFGTVFKGTWKFMQVAIKKIKFLGNGNIDATELQITQTLDELKILQSYPHDNILQVFGYSFDPGHPPCLVYQFMPNGSLEDRLQLRKGHSFSGGSTSDFVPLNWYQRLNIASGTANALQFLHSVRDKPLIHGDVKSANILLDKNFEPKLGDFGLAREGKSQSTSMKVSRVHGTKPYLPNDYLRSKKLSIKVDTYSYGIVLFEICTGLRAYDRTREPNMLIDLLKKVKEPADKESLRDQNAGCEREIYNLLFDIAMSCVPEHSTRRPDMTKVLSEVKSVQKFIDDSFRHRFPPPPYRLQVAPTMTGCTVSPPGSFPPSSYTSHMPPRSPVPQLMPVSNPSAVCHPPTLQPNGYYVVPHLPHITLRQGIGVDLRAHGGVDKVPESLVGAVGGDPPPPYREVVAPAGCGPMIGPPPIMIPKLDELLISPNSQKPTHHPSQYSRSDSSSYSNLSGSSTNTMQNVGRGKPVTQEAPVGPAFPGKSSNIANTQGRGHHNNPFVPLLPELGQLGPPSAVSKKSIFDDDEDEED